MGLNYLNVREDYNQDNLRVSMAHEVYHIWQQIHLPKVLHREVIDSSKITDRDDPRWLKQRNEYAAELFGLMYIKHRATEGFLDRIDKMQAIWDFTNWVKKFKKWRLQNKA